MCLSFSRLPPVVSLPTPQPRGSMAWSGLYTIHKGRSMGGTCRHYFDVVMGYVCFVALSVLRCVSESVYVCGGTQGTSPEPFEFAISSSVFFRRSCSFESHRIPNKNAEGEFPTEQTCEIRCGESRCRGQITARACAVSLITAPGRLQDQIRASLRS